MSEAMAAMILTAYDEDGNEYPIPAIQGPPYELTEEDKATIVQTLVEAMGVPVFGTVGEDKTITLTDELPEGVYTIRYATADGYADIGTIRVGGVAPEAPDTTLTFTAGLKIDSADGSITEGTAEYSASNLIPIVEGYKYTVYKKSSIIEGLKVCYYRADSTFISTSAELIAQTASQVSKEIPLIDGAAFFRLRIIGTASVIDAATWQVTAEAVTG